MNNSANSSLTNIIYALTQATARMPVELPRGLHLVYYPPADGQPARLIAARYLVAPGLTELRIVRDNLLAALDLHHSLVLDKLDDDWQETAQGDWQGYQIAWRTLSTAGAFSHDLALRGRVRLALEQREQRQLKRREQQRTQKPAANRGPKPML